MSGNTICPECHAVIPTESHAGANASCPACGDISKRSLISAEPVAPPPNHVAIAQGWNIVRIGLGLMFWATLAAAILPLVFLPLAILASFSHAGETPELL